MKKCTICNQTYTDESLNFCLSDGGTLVKMSDDAPPTVFMNQPRATDQTNWANDPSFSPPNYEPMSPWQDPSVNQTPSYMAANPYQSLDSTLPTVSLVLGILGIVLFFCCYAGVPFGIGALIVGFIGFNNTNKNPAKYGGRGLAIAGMIMGALSFLGFLLIILIAGIGNIR
jgi:hypothetical protein